MTVPGEDRTSRRVSNSCNSDRLAVVEDFAGDPCQLLAVIADGLGFEVRSRPPVSHLFHLCVRSALSFIP